MSTSSAAPVSGRIDQGWEPVREAFERNFADNDDVGAGVCVYHHGRPVVDLVGGWWDETRARPYGPDALQLVFSTTKGATAVVAAILADRGVLDYDAPVREYWPEFAANGKHDVTVSQLLCHQVGLPTIEPTLPAEDILDWDKVTAALAAMAPMWEPGTMHGYHAITYGWLVGEVCSRITGKPFGELFAAEVARPLGLDFWIGLPDDLESRVVPLIPTPPPTPEVAEMMEQFMGPDTLGGKALSLSGAISSDLMNSYFNRPEVHAACIPAANGITNARSLARMYAATIGEIDGVRLTSKAIIDRAREPVTSGPDQCILMETKIGMGFWANSDFFPLLGPGSFGHAGAGGSVGFASPEQDLSFGYVMNKMQMNLAGDQRTIGLIDAVRDCMGS